MSDFLKSFAQGEEAPSENGEVAGARPPPKVLRAPRNRFYKNDSSIHVVIPGKGSQNDQELVVERLVVTPSTFFNGSLIIYGAANSGKTTLLRYLMKMMREKFPIVFGFVPTEGEKHVFHGIVPEPLIFDTFGIDDVRSIYQRQKMASSFYNIAQKTEVLEALFKRVSNPIDRRHYNELLKLKRSALERVKLGSPDPGTQFSKSKEIEESFQFALRQLYQSVIRSSAGKLMNMANLTREEKTAVRYSDFNPNVLVFFDDATRELISLVNEGKKKKRGPVKSTTSDSDHEVINNFFYRSRHYNLTHWYTMHDDRELDPAIRKGAFYNIFCGPNSALAYFGKTANGFSPQEKKQAEAVIAAVFDSRIAPRWAKLVFSRLDHKFYYIVAELVEDFQMCSQPVREFCEQVSTRGFSLDKSNPYMSYFTEHLH